MCLTSRFVKKRPKEWPLYIKWMIFVGVQSGDPKMVEPYNHLANSALNSLWKLFPNAATPVDLIIYLILYWDSYWCVASEAGDNWNRSCHSWSDDFGGFSYDGRARCSGCPVNVCDYRFCYLHCPCERHSFHSPRRSCACFPRHRCQARRSWARCFGSDLTWPTRAADGGRADGGCESRRSRLSRILYLLMYRLHSGPFELITITNIIILNWHILVVFSNRRL